MTCLLCVSVNEIDNDPKACPTAGMSNLLLESSDQRTDLLGRQMHSLG